MNFFEKHRRHILRLVLSGMMLALALVLPFLTGQIQTIGSMLCPMHLPVMLCGFICGPIWGAVIGAVAPILRYALFSMPVLFPIGLSMAAELTVYGLVCGILCRLLGKKTSLKRVFGLYISLVSAMVLGRVAYGVVRFALCASRGISYTLAAFLAGTVVEAIPGIVIQLVLVVPLVLAADRLTRDRGL